MQAANRTRILALLSLRLFQPSLIATPECSDTIAKAPDAMDILRRLLTQTLRENQTEFQLPEARRNQVYMMQYENWQTMRRGLKLACGGKA